MPKEGQEAGTYEDFVKFLQQKVYPASGYRSLLKDCKSVKLSKIKPGDVWIQNGSVVMVVDVCVNAKGKKAFLLAQGGSPAAAVPCDIKSAASGRSMVLSERNPNFYEDADSGL